MADEIHKRDENRVTTVAGVTDDVALDITQLRMNPVTKRLKVDQVALDESTDSISSIITDPTTGDQASVNASGQLHTVMRGFESTDNSTTTPLSAGAVFTGTAEDTLDYSAISIVIHSDVASATDGLEVDYSADGTDWHAGETYTIEAGATKFFTPTLQARYLRVKYTNGASDQTDFHLHTVLRKIPIKWSSHNIDDPIKDEDDAELIKAVITGKRVDGVYDNVNLTNGSNMKVSLEELETGISSNSNAQLNVTPYHADGTEGVLVTGVKKETGKDGVDSSTNTLQTISYEHHEIHSGSTFRVQHYDDAIPATVSGGELVIAFHVPAGTKLPHMTWEFVHEGNMTMKVLEGITFAGSAGTNVAPKNSRRDSTTTSILQGKATGTLVSDFVTVGEESADSIYSGGTVISLKRNYVSRNEAASGSRRQELILKADTSYAFVLDNNETSTQGGQIRLEWYEHTDKN